MTLSRENATIDHIGFPPECISKLRALLAGSSKTSEPLFVWLLQLNCAWAPILRYSVRKIDYYHINHSKFIVTRISREGTLDGLKD